MPFGSPPGLTIVSFRGYWRMKIEPGKTVVPVGHGIQNGFANRALIECRDLTNEKAIFIMRDIIAKIYQAPELVQGGEKALSKLFPLLIRDRAFRRAIFKNDLGLRKMPAQRCASAEQN